MDLSQFGLGNGSSDAGALSIPGISNLQATLATITTISVVLGGLFLVLYIISLIQRVRADRAMIAMRKDIAAIRVLLEQQTAPQKSETTAPQPPAEG